jgi:dipeptidase E
MYSSGGFLNEEMDLALMQHFRSENPKMTFIASCFESASYYFDEFSDRFGRFGFDNLELLHLDHDFTAEDLNKCLNSELIYLSGGNTFYFLASMRETGAIRKLKSFVGRGGILAGHSAGAIIMTPEITTASYPEDDRDENDVGLRDWSGMGLVNFEIYPHFDPCDYYIDLLCKASLDSALVIYGVPDGSGVCINGPAISFFGEVWAFFNGEHFQVSGV